MSLPRHMGPLLVAALLCLIPLGYGAQGRGFRSVDPIATPLVGGLDGSVRHPVDASLVRMAVRTTLAEWNAGNLERYLADEFPYRQRLLDALVTDVPMDARLRLVSIGAPVTLRQRTEETTNGFYRVSRVQVRVRMQVVFNSVRTGFQRLPSESEMVFDIREPVSEPL